MNYRFTNIAEALAALPKVIENEKGTKFVLTINWSIKQEAWNVVYIWPPRHIKRKGFPVILNADFRNAITDMIVWIDNNHPELLS